MVRARRVTLHESERRFYRAKRGPLPLSLFGSSTGFIGAHGRAVQLEAYGAMNETVEDGVCQGGIVELAVPVGDGRLTGDDHRAAADAVRFRAGVSGAFARGAPARESQ